MDSNHLLKATITGYHDATPAERASFGMLGACAVTIAGARAITYGMERDRSAPRLRSWARLAYQAVEGDAVRVHHFVPGIALTLATGAAATMTRSDGHEFTLSVPPWNGRRAGPRRGRPAPTTPTGRPRRWRSPRAEPRRSQPRLRRSASTAEEQPASISAFRPRTTWSP